MTQLLYHFYEDLASLVAGCALVETFGDLCLKPCCCIEQGGTRCGCLFSLGGGDVAGHCFQLSRAVASMGGDWYWALGALVNLSSMITGN